MQSTNKSRFGSIISGSNCIDSGQSWIGGLYEGQGISQSVSEQADPTVLDIGYVISVLVCTMNHVVESNRISAWITFYCVENDGKAPSSEGAIETVSSSKRGLLKTRPISAWSTRNTPARSFQAGSWLKSLLYLRQLNVVNTNNQE